jgi:hypothetical protein
MKRFFTILAVSIVSVGIAFKIYEYNFYLSFVPKELKVWRIIYSENKSWGFGPGGNETGIVVYELPKDVADDIEKRGIRYFEEIPVRSGHGNFERWFSTPIEITKYWTDYMSEHPSSVPSIDNYLNAYGFGIPVSSDIKRMVDNAITKPNSYYSYGRIGVVIIAPDVKMVIYAFNG